MALWDFRRESTQNYQGANTLASLKSGYQAPSIAGNTGEGEAEKRNVIATSSGWVRRLNYTDTHSNARVKEIPIVAAHPGGGLAYTANTHLGNPDIVHIYVKLNANGYISSNTSGANLYVVFNMPITSKASGNLVSITVANTASGNNAVARWKSGFTNDTITSSAIINANNTLVFRLPKLMANTSNITSPVATYKVQAQMISVTGNPLYNPELNTGVGLSTINPGSYANLQITGAVSNNTLDVPGTRITTFRVATRVRQV